MENIRHKLLSLAERFRDDLLEFYRENIISVVLYGSVARGDCHQGSDINLFAVFKELPSVRTERYTYVEKALKSLNRDLFLLFRSEGILTDINLLSKSVEEMEGYSPLFLDMTEDAVILYDKDWFLTNKLAKIREHIKNTGAKRIWVGRMWFWQTSYVKQYAPLSLKQAEYHLKQGKAAFNDKFWNVSVREAIECLILSIRSLLRTRSVEIPSKFPTGNFLKIILPELPEDARKEIEDATIIFSRLYNDWNFSFYYDENIAGESIDAFKKKDAENALSEAERFYNLAKNVVKNSLMNKNG